MEIMEGNMESIIMRLYRVENMSLHSSGVRM